MEQAGTMPDNARGQWPRRTLIFVRPLVFASWLAACFIVPGLARAQTNDTAGESATDLAKKLQDPTSALYSLPFQLNTNLGYGPDKGTQELLNIQPVIPFHLNDNWGLVTRTVLPLYWQPSLAPAHTVPFGTGATALSLFLSPNNQNGVLAWRAGPVIQLPTASDKTLGSNVWGAGPSGILVYRHGPVVAGMIIDNIWSFGGTPGATGTRYNNFLLQPFFNYNFGGGWFVGTVPIITANWLASGNNAWTLPAGAQAGRLIRLGGKLPVDLLLGAYGNVLRPEGGPLWQIRAQMTIVF